MVEKVCSKVDSCIDCVQPFTCLCSIEMLIFKLLVWILWTPLLRSSLLVLPLRLTAHHSGCHCVADRLPCLYGLDSRRDASLLQSNDGKPDHLSGDLIVEELLPKLLFTVGVGHQLIMCTLHVWLFLKDLLHHFWRQLQCHLHTCTHHPTTIQARVPV